MSEFSSPKYSEFRQAVRRYRPSDLLPALAQHSAAKDPHSTPGYGTLRQRTPWAVSAMARESLLYGTEHRSGRVTEAGLTNLYNVFNNSYDETPSDAVEMMLAPIMYEQFSYQESQFEELSRIHALFNDPELGDPFDWSDLLGMELDHAVRASMVLHAWVAMNGGRYDPGLLDQDNLQEVFQRALPREHVEQIVQMLSTTVDEVREEHAVIPALPSFAQRYSFNPLTAKPLVDLGDAGIWAPQTMLVSRVLHPANLYYRGIRAGGEDFSRALGLRHEAYVGRQLELIAGSNDLYGEIEYKSGQKSIDWIWVTRDAIILIECKSARPTAGARAGVPSRDNNLSPALAKARTQLQRSAKLIRDQHPAFADIPHDRRIIGLTMTTDPMHMANWNRPHQDIESGQNFPIMVMSLRELEFWTTHQPVDALRRFLEVVDDRERGTWAFEQSLKRPEGNQKNPILDAAWKHYDFMDRTMENTEQPTADRAALPKAP